MIRRLVYNYFFCFVYFFFPWDFFFFGGGGDHWIFRITEEASVITESPKGGSVNLKRPYRLCGRLFGTLNSNFAVFERLGSINLHLYSLLLKKVAVLAVTNNHRN